MRISSMSCQNTIFAEPQAFRSDAVGSKWPSSRCLVRCCSKQATCRRRASRSTKCIRAARHQELEQGRKFPTPPEKQRVYDYEVDERYRRYDMSGVFALEFRQALATNLQRGEAGIKLGEAALQVAGEDDAIATHPTVKLPTASFVQRIQRLAEELAFSRLPAVLPCPVTAENADAALKVVEQFLFEECRFKIHAKGRSGLPQRAVVDHPGVWEDARLCYLNEVLVRKVGHPASIAILYSDIMQRLLSLGAVDFAVRMECRQFQALPVAVPLPNLTRALITSSDGSILNTCTSEALQELLRYLKRSYWPFKWDTNVDNTEAGGKGSHGGFRAAARAALGEEEDSGMKAITAVAQHRLQRGIWTSPGGGDVRRALAACERLVMVLGDEDPAERRDLAMVLLQMGEVDRARLELSTYIDSEAFKEAQPVDAQLAQQVMDLLNCLPVQDHSARLTSMASVLEMDRATIPVRVAPLTW